jgi:hypothetical protein
MQVEHQVSGAGGEREVRPKGEEMPASSDRVSTGRHLPELAIALIVGLTLGFVLGFMVALPMGGYPRTESAPVSLSLHKGSP